MAAASGYTDLREKLGSHDVRDNYKAGSREAAAALPPPWLLPPPPPPRPSPTRRPEPSASTRRTRTPSAGFEQQLQEGGGGTQGEERHPSDAPVVAGTSAAPRSGARIDEVVSRAEKGLYNEHTVDRAPLHPTSTSSARATYGAQLQEARARPGGASTRPATWTEIPEWVHQLVIREAGRAPSSPRASSTAPSSTTTSPAVCIVSHVDPIHIFERPIVSVSFFSDSALCFGCKFQFKPIRVSEPVLSCRCRERDCAQVTAWEEGGHGAYFQALTRAFVLLGGGGDGEMGSCETRAVRAAD